MFTLRGEGHTLPVMISGKDVWILKGKGHILPVTISGKDVWIQEGEGRWTGVRDPVLTLIKRAN